GQPVGGCDAVSLALVRAEPGCPEQVFPGLDLPDVPIPDSGYWTLGTTALDGVVDHVVETEDLVEGAPGAQILLLDRDGKAVHIVAVGEEVHLDCLNRYGRPADAVLPPDPPGAEASASWCMGGGVFRGGTAPTPGAENA